MNHSKLICWTAALLLGGGMAWAQDPPKPLTSVAAKPGAPTATVDLGKEFPQIAELKGFTFRQQLTTVPPGAGMAWHAHVGAPEIVRVLSGTLTEQREDGPPKTYGPGSTLVNAAGIHHQWANLGAEPVVMLGTSIHPPQPTGSEMGAPKAP